MPNIHVFFHVARMGSFWREVVENVCGAIDGSGINNAATGLHCVTVGSSEMLLNYLSMDTAKWSVENGGDLWRYEYPTLQALWKHAKANPSDYLLYLHTKGVREESNGRWARGQWRRWMMWHVITRWRECVQLLDTHDTVGAWWQPGTHPHYAGNFWWARADYVAKLEEPKPLTVGDGIERAWAEFWLGTGNGKHFDFGTPTPSLRAEYCGKIYQENLEVIPCR